MVKDGWKYAPPPKDENHKKHPDLVAWEELPEQEKENNRSMGRKIPAFLARAGFQVERLKNETAKSLTI